MPRTAGTVAIIATALFCSNLFADQIGSSATLPPADCVRASRSARIALESGDTETARTLLRNAVDSYPGEVAPLIELLDLERRVGGTPEQLAELRRTLGARLEDPDAPLASGTVEYLVEGVGDRTDELELLSAALAKRVGADTDDTAMLRAQAGIQDRLGATDEAYALWLKIHEIAPTSGTFWRLATREVREERWSALRDRLRPMVEANKAAGYFRIAYLQSLAHLGDVDELERILNATTPESQVERIAYDMLRMRAAWAARDKGYDDRARSLLDAVIESDPGHEVATNALLYLYGVGEKISSGELTAEDALSQGAGLLATGDFAGALPLLRQAVRGLADSEVAWFNLGLAALKAENWDEAEKALMHASRINPTRPDAYFNRGAALTQLKRYGEAIDTLNKALQLDPSMKAVHYYLYQSYQGQGDREAASRHLKIYQDK